MSSVDKRVVEMQFENKSFLDRIGESLTALNKLKMGLSLDDAFSNLTKASNKFSLDGVEKSIDTLTNKFSIMHFAGIAAITNLTNEVVNKAKTMASALTIDPITTGFSEYETQINAVQTILANTQKEGTTVETVNKALDELNAYSDKTIYNFTEMTKNIGTFTAAGVKLDTSVDAIKGIANLAAVSGSNSQQAATAMYQLSQALSTGTVKLMDWNSVNNAGMGGAVFQDSLKETARVHKINIDKIIKQEGSFRDSLSTGWLSSEILLETLSKFTGDLTAEQLKQMGYNEKQTQEILKLGEMANDSATKVKTVTQLMGVLEEAAQSGWAQTWRIIVGDFEEARSFLTEMSETLKGVIDKSAAARNSMLQGWSDLNGRTVLIQAIRNILNSILAVTGAVGEAFRSIFPPMTSKQLYDLTVQFIRFTRTLIPSEKTLAIMKRTLRGLFSFVKIGVDILKLFANAIWLVVKEFSPLIDMALGAIVTLGEFGNNLRVSTYSVDTFGTALGFVKNVIKGVKDGLGTMNGEFAAASPSIIAYFENLKLRLIELKDKFVNWWKGLDPKAVEAGLQVGFIGVILLAFKKFLNLLNSWFGPGSAFAEAVTGVLDEVRNSLQAYQTTLKASTIKKIAIAIGILAASIILLSFIDKEKLVNGLMALTVIFVELFGAMILFGKFAESDGFTNIKKVALSMIGISIAILILAHALSVLSKIKVEDPKSFIFIILMLSALATFVEKVKDSGGDMIKTAFAISILSISLLILSKSIERLGVLPFNQLVSGLAAIIISLTAITIAINRMPTKDIPSLSIKLLGISSAMYVMATALLKMSVIPVFDLAKSLLAFFIVLELIVQAIKKMTPKKSIAAGEALLMISAGVFMLATAIKILASIEPLALAIALTGLAVAFGIFVATAYALKPVSDILKTLSLFLGVLGFAFMAIGVGLVAFSIGLSSILTTLILFGGVATVLFTQLAKGVLAMIDVFIDGMDKVGELITTFISTLIMSFFNSIKSVTDSVMTVISAILNAILVRLPELIVTGAKIVFAFLQGIAENIYEIAAIGVTIVLNFIDGVASKMGEILLSAANLIINFINGLADTIRTKGAQIRAAVWNLVSAIISSLEGFYTNMREAVSKFVSDIVTKLKEYMDEKWEELKGIGRNMMEGLKQGILDMASDIANAAKNVVSWAVDGVKKSLKIKSPSRVFMEIGEFMNAGLVKGINSTANSVKDSVVETGSLAVNAMSKAISKINELALSDMDFNPVITPVIDLSNVNSGISKLNSDLSANRSLSIGASVSAANTISRSQNGIDLSEVPQSASNSNTYIFNQTNNSPKALSRIDIYRQTKNQFATLKGLVEGT